MNLTAFNAALILSSSEYLLIAILLLTVMAPPISSFHPSNADVV